MSVRKFVKDGRNVWGFDVVVDGKRVRKSSGEWTKRAAADAERLFLARQGVVDGMRYAELFDLYITHMAPQRKATTIRKHKDTNRVHIAPYFDKKVVAKIKKADVIAWQNQILEAEHDGKPYSNNMLIGIQALLRAVLNFGVESGVIATNPFNFKTVTRVQKKEEMIVWTPQQFEEFAANIEDPLYDAMFRAMYYGGLRKGEAIALNVEDFDGKGLNISKTYDRYNAKTTAPKTLNSYRYVALDSKTCAAISRLVELYPEVPETAHAPLFGFSHRVSPTQLERVKNKYLQMTDLPFLTLHGFRHSHASYLLEKGIRTRDVAARLGNTEEMVIKRYSHIIAESQDHITKLFE